MQKRWIFSWKPAAPPAWLVDLPLVGGLIERAWSQATALGLRELLPQWQLRAPARHDFGRIDEVFPSASYQYVLYGMGFRPDAAGTTRRRDAAAADTHFREAAALTRRMLAALPAHRALIDHVRQHGLPRL